LAAAMTFIEDDRFAKAEVFGLPEMAQGRKFLLAIGLMRRGSAGPEPSSAIRISPGISDWRTPPETLVQRHRAFS
jgi:hypothetical protein